MVLVRSLHYSRFFADTGRDVVRVKHIEVASTLAIAQVEEEVTRAAIQAVDGDDVDGIVQVGTDLVMARLADEAERWLGKPVLAVNAVMLWHALRAIGVCDSIPGFGALLRDH
jgi:maleate isomerase